MTGPKVDWLGEPEFDDNGDPMYPLDAIRQKFEVRRLAGDGYLALNRTSAFWLKFAVLTFAERELDGSDEKVFTIFHGEGALGDLRECRHTWWGDGGYLFYPDGAVITSAFRELAWFFDDMVEK